MDGHAVRGLTSWKQINLMRALLPAHVQSLGYSMGIKEHLFLLILQLQLTTVAVATCTYPMSKMSLSW